MANTVLAIPRVLPRYLPCQRTISFRPTICVCSMNLMALMASLRIVKIVRRLVNQNIGRTPVVGDPDGSYRPEGRVALSLVPRSTHATDS